MKKIFLSGVLLLSFLSLLSTEACNNSGKSSKQKADSINKANQPIAKQDAQFMVKAAIGGMMEVDMGKVAQQQAQNDRVKGFGQMMVTDHSRINSKLKTLASEKQVALPDSVDQNKKNDIENLKNKSASDFDKDYIDDMVKDHKSDINDFQDALDNVHNSDLKAFINQALPVLKMHLDSAQQIQNSLKSN